jgi:hypothetical protein
LNIFETAGIVGYSEGFKKVKTPPWAKICRLWMGTSVRPQMVDFGSKQGLSNFETGGASEANAYRGA